MLARMWRKRISFALLVGMQAGAAIWKTVWRVLKKLKIELPYYLAIALLGIFFNFLNVYLFLRESMSKGGAEREGDTESKAGFRLQAVSTEPNTGLELTNHEIMT